VATRPPSATPWQDDGFAQPPEEKDALGGEVAYRAYGGSSAKWGNCFFVPAIGSTPILYWTAELLETELNAALWGNDFEGVTKFEMIKGARYRIGPIAHDNYVGVDGGLRFYQRSFLTPSGIFKQIKFLLAGTANLRSCVKQLGSPIAIASGRYAREASARAKKFVQ
jgi:hypothetical protein